MCIWDEGERDKILKDKEYMLGADEEAMWCTVLGALAV
jgi:hypothetical protein